MIACPTCSLPVGACAHCHQAISSPDWVSLTQHRLSGRTRHLHYHQVCLDAGEIVTYLTGTEGALADVQHTSAPAIEDPH